MMQPAIVIRGPVHSLTSGAGTWLARCPWDPETKAVKRVIGLEGDVIRTREPYPVPTVRVPPGHIWVEGDGGERDSWDSNAYGPVARALVIGKVTHILWPLHRAGRVPWERQAEQFRKHI